MIKHFLAAITGNVGVPGGWASGLGLQAPDGGGLWTVFPTGENPVKAAIPVFLWVPTLSTRYDTDRPWMLAFAGAMALTTMCVATATVRAS